MSARLARFKEIREASARVGRFHRCPLCGGPLLPLVWIGPLSATWTCRGCGANGRVDWTSAGIIPKVLKVGEP